MKKLYHPESLSPADRFANLPYIPDEVIDLAEKYQNLQIPNQAPEFFAAIRSKFKHMLIQHETSSKRYNFTVSTMGELIEISQKISTYLVKEYTDKVKFSSPEDCAVGKELAALNGNLLKFIRQLNENEFLRKNESQKSALLAPGMDLLIYDHSYDNIRTALAVVNNISHHTNFSLEKFRDEFRSHIKPLVEFLNPVATFLKTVGEDLSFIITQVKTSASEKCALNDEVKITVDAKSFSTGLHQNLMSALKKSLSWSLDDSALVGVLLNDESKSFNELAKGVQTLVGKDSTSLYQVVGELFLVKMLQDISRKRNEEVILSILIETLHLCDQYTVCSGKEDESVNPFSFVPELWHAKAIYTLLNEITQIEKCQAFGLIESCIRFFCFYSGQRKFDSTGQGNELLESVFSEIPCSFPSLFDRLLQLWNQSSIYSPKDLSSALEAEFSHELPIAVLVNLLRMIDQVYHRLFIEGNEVNALYQEANTQIFDWMYSKILTFDFSANFIPVSLYRNFHKNLRLYQYPQDQVSFSIYKPIEILQKLKEMVIWIDFQVLLERSPNRIEEEVITEYITSVVELFSTSPGPSHALWEIVKSEEFLELLGYKWQGGDNSPYLRCKLFRALLESTSCYRMEFNRNTVSDIPADSLTMYLKLMKDVKQFNISDLNFIMTLSDNDWSYVEELMKFRDSIKEWITKCFITPEDCFTSMTYFDRTLRGMMDTVRWDYTHGEAQGYAQTLVDYFVDIVKIVNNNLKTAASDFISTVQKNPDSRYTFMRAKSSYYRSSCLASIWFQIMASLAKIKNSYSKLGALDIHQPITFAAMNTLFFMWNPLVQEDKLIASIKEQMSISEFSNDISAQLARIAILMTKTLEDGFDFTIESPDYPINEAKIAYNILKSEGDIKSSSTPRLVKFVKIVQQLNAHKPLVVGKLSNIKQGPVLYNDLSDVLWYSMRSFAWFLAQNDQVPKDKDTEPNALTLETLREHWNDLLDLIVIKASQVNDQSNKRYIFQELSRKVFKECLNQKKLDFYYLFYLKFVQTFYQNKLEAHERSELAKWLGSNPLGEGYIVLDLLQKAISLANEAEENPGTRENELLQDLLAPGEVKLLPALISDTLVEAEAVKSSTSATASFDILHSQLDSWKEAWKKVETSESKWRKQFLERIMQSLLVPLFLVCCKTKLIKPSADIKLTAKDLIQKRLASLNCPSSPGEKISIIPAEESSAYTSNSGSKDSSYLAVQQLLGLSIYCGFELSLLKIGTTAETNMQKYIVADVVINLLADAKSEFIDNSKFLLSKKSPEEILSQEFAHAVADLTKPLSRANTLIELKPFDHLWFQLVSNLKDDVSMLSPQEVSDLLLIITQQTADPKNASHESIFLDCVRRAFPTLIKAVNHALICYQQENSTQIEDIKELHKTLLERCEKLIPALCKLALTEPFRQELSAAEAAYDLILTLAYDTTDKKLFFDPVIMEFLAVCGLRKDLFLYGATILFENSFSGIEYVEALIKYSFYHAKSDTISFKKHENQCLGSDIFQSALTQFPEPEGVKDIADRLLQPTDDKELSFRLKTSTSLNTVQVSPDAGETDFFERIAAFGLTPASKFVDFFIQSIINNLRTLLLKEKQVSQDAPEFTEMIGFNSLRALSSLIVCYPFLGPYLFFKDISKFLEADTEVISRLDQSVLTNMINNQVLSKYGQHVKAPFVSYLLEMLVVPAAPIVNDFLEIWLTMPVPLLFKDENSHKGYLDFVSFVKQCLDARILNGLRDINHKLSEESASKPGKTLSNDVLREILLAASYPLTIWISKTDAIQKDEVTQDIWNEILRTYLSCNAVASNQTNWIRDALLVMEKGILSYIFGFKDLSNDHNVKKIWTEQGKLMVESLERIVTEDFKVEIEGKPLSKGITRGKSRFGSRKHFSTPEKRISLQLPYYFLGYQMNSTPAILGFLNHRKWNDDGFYSATIQLLKENLTIVDGLKLLEIQKCSVLNPSFDENIVRFLTVCNPTLQQSPQPPSCLDALGKLYQKTGVVSEEQKKEEQKKEEQAPPSQELEKASEPSIINAVEEKEKPIPSNEESKKPEPEEKMFDDSIDNDLADMEATYESEISSLNSSNLHQRLQEAKKILKKFEEEDSLNSYLVLYDPQNLFSPKKKPKLAEKSLAFIEKLPKLSRLLVLGLITPETMEKFPKRLRVLSAKIRKVIKNTKKRNKRTIYRPNYYGDKSEVNSEYSLVLDECFDDLFEQANADSDKKEKGGEAEEKFETHIVTGNQLRKLMNLSESTAKKLAEMILITECEFENLEYILMVPSNLLMVSDLVLLYSELYFIGHHQQKKLIEFGSDKEITPQFILDRLEKFFKGIIKNLPRILLVSNQNLVKYRSKLEEHEQAKHDYHNYLVLDRLIDLVPLLPLKTSDNKLTAHLENITSALEENSKRPKDTPNMIPQATFLRLAQVVFDFKVVTTKQFNVWINKLMKDLQFSSKTLPEIFNIMNKLFKDLWKKIEKSITLIKSKSEKDLKEVSSRLVGSEIKYICRFMQIAVDSLHENKPPSEPFLKFTQQILQSDTITETILSLYELLEKLSERLSFNELQNNPLSFYLVSIISYHVHFYNIERESKNPIDSQPSNNVPDLEDLELPETELSRYISKDFDVGNLDVTPKLGKSYSEMRRSLLDGIRLDVVFSHLTFKSKKLFQAFAACGYDFIKTNEILGELSKHRHWITAFETKFKHLLKHFKTPTGEPYESGYIRRDSRKLRLRRTHLLEDSIKYFQYVTEKDKRLTVQVHYSGEEGYDAGGLRRAWYSEIIKTLTDPKFGLFKIMPNQRSIQPNPLSVLVANHLELFEFLGIMMAKVIQEQLAVDVHFTKSFYKHLIGKPLYLEDLEDVDAQLMKSMKWILENNAVESLGETFTYQVETLDGRVMVPLKPGGENIDLTNENKREFVRLLCQRKLTEEIKDQIKAFKKGFHLLIPEKALELMGPGDLEYLIAGEQVFDIVEWREYMVYEGGLNETDELVTWFWEILSIFSNEELSQYLYFVTGSSRVPVGGFKTNPLHLSLSENGMSEIDLPIAHTCSHGLEIPRYLDPETMREKIMIAMYEGIGGFYVS